MGTIDGHLIAHRREDRRPGLERRGRRRAARTPATRFTLAPLVVKDKVIVGTGRRRVRHSRIHRRVRCEDRQGSRGASTRFPAPASRGNETWAGNSWKPGGGSIWVTGSVRSGSQPDVLGHRQSRVPTGTAIAGRRQPVQRLGRRARCRHRQAEMAFPVHAARRVRLRLDAGAGARRHPVAGPAAQGDAVGESQRLLVRARSRERPVPAGQAVRRR